MTNKKQEREQFLRKGEKILGILEILTHGAAVTHALMVAFAPGTTYSMVKNMRGRHERINRFFENAKERQKLYNLLSYLQRKGLVTKEIKGKDTFWKITQKGQDKQWRLNYQLANADNRIKLSSSGYAVEQGDRLVIIAFDIPEKEKFKRDWFRSVLKNLGFLLIQKSVWMGQIKIPQQLIKDLKKLNILDFIKIFSVVEIGNLD